MTEILNSEEKKRSLIEKHPCFFFSPVVLHHVTRTNLRGSWLIWIFKRFISSRHACVTRRSSGLCAHSTVIGRPEPALPHVLPRQPSRRAFPHVCVLLHLHLYWFIMKNNQGRDGASYFGSRTTSAYFFFLFPQGFFYAERQNFGMMLHGRWRWWLATNTATSPSASGVLRASEWVGLYE